MRNPVDVQTNSPGQLPIGAVLLLFLCVLPRPLVAAPYGINQPSQAGEVASRRIDEEREVVTVLKGGRAVTTLRRAPVLARPSGRTAAGDGPLLNGDFSNALAWWTWSQSGGASTPGQVFVESEQAVMFEGDSFVVTLEQTFFIPAGGQTLSFDLVLSPGFDMSSVFIPDAFEAQLLDQNNLPVVPTWDPLATSFFNIQETQDAGLDCLHPDVNCAPGVTFDGITVTVDVTGVPAGTVVTIYFDFIGADFDMAGGVRLDNVQVTCLGGQCPKVPAASAWGLVVTVLLLAVVGTLILRRSALEGKETRGA